MSIKKAIFGGKITIREINAQIKKMKDKPEENVDIRYIAWTKRQVWTLIFLFKKAMKDTGLTLVSRVVFKFK